MIRSLKAVAVAATFAFAGALFAQDRPSLKALTPEASLSARTLSDLQLSPDGERLLFVVAEPAKGELRPRHIWIYQKRSHVVRQFTFSGKSESAPRWSPDGKQVAFLSNRDGDDEQIYLMRADGGEGRAVTKGKRSVQNFEWSPNGRQIAFLAPEAKSEAEEKKAKDRDDAHIVDQEDKRTRLWLLTIGGGDAKALTKADWEIQELSWLPSGLGLVLIASDHPESDQNTDKIFGLQLSSETMTLLLTPRGPIGGLRMSADGKTIGFVGCREDGPSPHDLLLMDLDKRAARNLTGLGLDRPIEDYRWERNGDMLVIAADGFRRKFVAFSALGAPSELPATVSTNPLHFATSGTGDVFFVGQTATQPQELWQWDQKGAAKQISQLNDGWKNFALGTPEIYKYKSFDGLEIEAALLTPAGYDGKSRLPLVTFIHGGPTGNWEDAVEPWGQLLAARGYGIFYPNIRGSIGYGQKFIEMNRRDWGGADFKDMMAGIDDLIAKGVADPDRLAIGGWSYGGFMAEWAITQTPRFKASVSGAGLSNLISEYGTEQHPSYDEWFYGVPYERPEGFLNSSPFLYLKNVKTPTLILQGDADTVDPLGQSQELYRGLKRYGVETELVVYPREPHGFHEEKHLLDRTERILAWYDKYLKKPEPGKAAATDAH